MQLLVIGESIALSVAFCWTFTVISFEYAGKRVGSLPVNFIRLVIGFILISIFTLLTTGSILPIDASPETWKWLILSGFIGFVIGDLFLFQSFVDVGARVAMLIMSLSPPLTSLISYFVLGEALSTIDIVGMFITVAGISYVVSIKKQSATKHNNTLRGIIFAIIGALGQSVALILSKIGAGDYNAFQATQIRIISAIIGFTIFFFIRKEWSNVRNALKDRKAMKVISIGSFFGPFLGVSLSLMALQYTYVGVASTIMQLNVILVIPFSMLLFKEKISYKEVIGALIAFTGVAIMFI